MAAKIVILALAVCSTYGQFLGQDNCFQDNFGCGQGLSFAAQPNIVLPASQSFAQASSCGPVSEFAQPFTPSTDCISSAQSFVSAPSYVSGSDFLSAGSPSFGQEVDFEVASTAGVSTGPVGGPKRFPVIQVPPVNLRPIESPIIRLPSPPIPPPRVIRHRCYCTKTIVRPQVIQRTINVPRIQRYLKQTFRPVVENVAYQAKPVGNDVRGEDIVIGGTQTPGQIAGPLSFVSGGFDGAQGLDCQNLEGQAYDIPAFQGQTFDAPAFEAPAFQAPAFQAQAFDAPSFDVQGQCDSVVPSYSRCY